MKVVVCYAYRILSSFSAERNGDGTTDDDLLVSEVERLQTVLYD